jgi:hypothetical protein
MARTVPLSPTSPSRGPDTAQYSPKSIADRFTAGIPVLLTKNQYPHAPPRRYRVTTIEKLLTDAVSILDLPGRAERIYAADGTAIQALDGISEQATLVISTGEPFRYSAPSPNSLRAKYTSPPPAHGASSPASPQSPKTTEASPKLTRRQREYHAFQRLVALAPRTAEETMKLAAASVYDSLTAEQRSKCSEPDQMDKLRNSVQEGLFNSHLYRENIVVPFLEDGITAKVIEMLTRLPLSDVKFVVAGPRQSGKTAVLHTMATVLNRKLQVSVEAGRYLIFPLNFELDSLQLAEPSALVRLFVTTAFDALEYSSLRFVPVIDGLRRWFLLSVFGSAASAPSFNGQLDVAAVQSLARSLAAALTADTERGIEDFFRKVAAFPREFAAAFGFTDALYVFDSFEFSSIQLEPSRSTFSRSLRGGNFADFLCAELSNSSYVVAMQNEQDFMETFSCTGAALIDTQRFLAPAEAGVIEIVEPSLQITMEDCNGCPGFIGRFRRLGEEVQRSADYAAIPGQFGDLKTVSDISRRQGVKFGILRLAALLNSAKNEKFTLDVLNELADVEDLFARFVGPPEEVDDDRYGVYRTHGVVNESLQLQ